ncbi:aromatic prenyltransferase [Streptomyces sp. NPDC051636]|uniref:aromatic prenyltransferase n=1 Tax=Streptomyces sp. NPDC051636 TaxID=3365663 RepID=UPI003789A541
MPETSELADLYSAIEKSAGLHGVPYSHDKVRSVLTAYKDAVTAPHTMIAFRMGTGRRYESDVDWRFSVPQETDPYAVALANGLTESTDHPLHSLFAEVVERTDAVGHGIDFGASHGFKKIYVLYSPNDMEPLSTLADLPSMPKSLAGNYDFFARHGMGGKQLMMFALDYQHRTVNVYINGLSAESLTEQNLRSVFRDLELPEPSERLLKLGERAAGVYATLSWDSPKVERFCFTNVAKDPGDLPVPMEPKIKKFLASIPRRTPDDTFLYYVAMSSTGEELYKFQWYYRFPTWLNPMLQSDTAENQGN